MWVSSQSAVSRRPILTKLWTGWFSMATYQCSVIPYWINCFVLWWWWWWLQFKTSRLPFVPWNRATFETSCDIYSAAPFRIRSRVENGLLDITQYNTCQSWVGVHLRSWCLALCVNLAACTDDVNATLILMEDWNEMRQSNNKVESPGIKMSQALCLLIKDIPSYNVGLLINECIIDSYMLPIVDLAIVPLPIKVPIQNLYLFSWLRSSENPNYATFWTD